MRSELLPARCSSGVSSCVTTFVPLPLLLLLGEEEEEEGGAVVTIGGSQLAFLRTSKAAIACFSRARDVVPNPL